MFVREKAPEIEACIANRMCWRWEEIRRHNKRRPPTMKCLYCFCGIPICLSAVLYTADCLYEMECGQWPRSLSFTRWTNVGNENLISCISFVFRPVNKQKCFDSTLIDTLSFTCQGLIHAVAQLQIHGSLSDFHTFSTPISHTLKLKTFFFQWLN